MFVLRSSTSVQVGKKMFGIIYKRRVQISIGGEGEGVEKKSKVNKQGVGRSFSTQE